MFIRITNGMHETYTIEQLRRDNSNVSFPKAIPAETLANYDVCAVKRTPAPQIDSRIQRLTQNVQMVEGEWVQVWTTVERPADQAAENVRAHRDTLLSETDWIAAVSYERGETVPQEWTVYRQALRDITDQSGFPYSVEWPTKPE